MQLFLEYTSFGIEQLKFYHIVNDSLPLGINSFIRTAHN